MCLIQIISAFKLAILNQMEINFCFHIHLSQNLSAAGGVKLDAIILEKSFYLFKLYITVYIYTLFLNENNKF